jgi:2-oxoglutarate ferredoxin oxidoreductase subunit beta
MVLALALGATFIARSWSGDLTHLVDTMVAALHHRGAALLDVLQPCVTFNRNYAYDYYRPRVYKVEEESDYNPANREGAWKKAQEWGDHIPLGVIYRVEGQPTHEDQVAALAAGSLVKQGFRAWTETDSKALALGLTSTLTTA